MSFFRQIASYKIYIKSKSRIWFFRQIAQIKIESETMNSYITGTFFILTLGLIYVITNYGQQCPHPSFKLKHYCEDCEIDIDAMDFTHRRRTDTSRNSVLAGKNLEFEIINGRCQNTNSSTVFECQLTTGSSRGYCRTRKNCKTFHSTFNGHMYYRDTFCRNWLENFLKRIIKWIPFETNSI